MLSLYGYRSFGWYHDDRWLDHTTEFQLLVLIPVMRCSTSSKVKISILSSNGCFNSSKPSLTQIHLACLAEQKAKAQEWSLEGLYLIHVDWQTLVLLSYSWYTFILTSPCCSHTWTSCWSWSWNWYQHWPHWWESVLWENLGNTQWWSRASEWR